MRDPFLIKGGLIDNIIEAKFILIPCKTKGSLEAMKSQVGIYLTIASLSYCNSMPFGAAWAYYGKVLVLISVALLNGRMHSNVK